MKKKGFTLIELLAVIIIIAVIGAIGVVSYRTFFDNGSSSYYKSVESDILLSANDYFLDNRDILPVTSNYKEVNLNELVDKKYVEEILNSSGEKCDGKVIVYKENGKYSYDVCLDCGNYKSTGKYCQGGLGVPKNIIITARTSNTNQEYNVTASYDRVEYINNENVIVSFDMENVEVSKYEIVNTSNGEKLVCNSFSAGGNKCEKTISKSGTYRVSAYDKDEKLLISNQQFNIKILENGLDFSINGINEKYKISQAACASGNKKATVTFAIKKNPNKLNEEYKKIEYKLRRNEVDGSYKEVNKLEITEELESGHYDLEVRITNFAGATTIRTATFNVSYDINMEYDDDGSTGTHEVVQGYAYDYLSQLPTHKRAYGVDNLEIKWYKGETRVYGTSTVEDSCTHKLIGNMAIQVDVPSNWKDYCKDLTYNADEVVLTKQAPANVTFVDNSARNAGKYTVKAHINSPLYIWKDQTFADKTFECEIKKRDVNVVATDQNKVYDGTALTADNTCTMAGAVTGHMLTCTGNSGTITNAGSVAKTVGTATIKSGSLDVTSNYDIKKVNGTLTVTKIDAAITCTNPNYTGSSLTIASCSGGTLSNHTRTGAGSQTVTCTGDANHNTVTESCSVNKVPATITCSDKNYTGSAQTACSCSGGTIGGTYSATNAGTYTASCTGDANHTNPSNKSWTISKVNAVITCTNPNYTGSSLTIASCSGGTLSNHTRTGAGSQTVTCTGDANHNTVTKSCSVNKVAAVISCSNKSYNGSAQTGCSCSGGTIGGTYKATNAGTYTASCTGDANHTNPSNKSWTISKVAAVISCSNKSYNGSAQTGCSCSGGTIGGTYKATNAGTYTASCTGDANHTNPSNKSWTISKVAATLSCSDKTYTGSAQTGCSCSGGTVGGTYRATNVGTYTASCTGDSNHTSPSNKSWAIKSPPLSWKINTVDYYCLSRGGSYCTIYNYVMVPTNQCSDIPGYLTGSSSLQMNYGTSKTPRTVGAACTKENEMGFAYAGNGYYPSYGSGCIREESSGGLYDYQCSGCVPMTAVYSVKCLK